MKKSLKLYILILLAVSCAITTTVLTPENASVVERNGHLRIEGTHIVSQNSDPVVLYGVSLFWSQYVGNYYNYDCIKWLRNDWHCTVVRAALGIGRIGYLATPDVEMEKIKTVVEACIDLGIYVIVDWHDHQAEEHQAEAIDFFTQIATLYGDKPNVIYEIYNEPLRVSWTDVVKPYSEAVISAIRKIDPDNLILVGSPHWSQDVDVASLNPIEGKNIAYTLHFYAGTHKEWLMDKATTAINNGMALFVSEFGMCNSDGNGPIDHESSEKWFAYMKQHNLSWCKWSVADKQETSAVLKPGASATGHWSESELSESGKLIRAKIREMNP
ncbi:glycoside hydrolase family 5 protein [candidate division KSB1 bacterium]|nr:glycoside hydrolase family 5 protein [candidate division KSB1 bacterium]